MDSTMVGLVVFACTFGGARLGTRLRTSIPDGQLDVDTKESVKMAVGLVATMAALVLGLVTSSAKSSFDDADDAVKRTSVSLLVLDRHLAQYGPETRAVREGIKRLVERRAEEIWPSSRSAPAPRAGEQESDGMSESIRALRPKDDHQRELRDAAVAQVDELMKTRWLIRTGVESTIPPVFLIMLVFWLTVTFSSFGLFAPRNRVATFWLVLCSFSVGAAVFLVLELGTPFDGTVKVSRAPITYALARLGR